MGGLDHLTPLATLSDELGLMKREEPALSEGLPLSPESHLLGLLVILVTVIDRTVSPGSCSLSWLFATAATSRFNSTDVSWSPVSKLWLLQRQTGRELLQIRQDVSENTNVNVSANARIL